MTIAQRIELRRLGYSKEEVNELAELEKTPAVETAEPTEPAPDRVQAEPLPTEPATEPATTDNVQAQLLSAINNLTAVLQNQKLNSTPQPEVHKETTQDIFNNILKG